MTKDAQIEQAIEALRVGIRNAQAGSRHQEADMTMRAIEGLRDLQQRQEVDVEEAMTEIYDRYEEWGMCVKRSDYNAIAQRCFEAGLKAAQCYIRTPDTVSLSMEEFEKVKEALVLYNTGSSVKHPQIREKGVEALAILNKHGGNNA